MWPTRRSRPCVAGACLLFLSCLSPLSRKPAVSALRLAITIPLEEWETELIVRLLRHGQIRPAWPRADRLTLSTAASTIRATPCFRGREKLLQELDRALARCESDAGIEAERIRQARAIAVRLFEVLSPLDRPRPWTAQVAELRRVADALGVAAGEAEVLDPLWDALDDRSDVREQLGRDGQSWTWADFVAEVGAVISEACGLESGRCARVNHRGDRRAGRGGNGPLCHRRRPLRRCISGSRGRRATPRSGSWRRAGPGHSAVLLA